MITACDSYDWNGITYTESGVYIYSTNNSVGCDSTATLNLTINTSSSSSDDLTACDSYDWNGITYTESGIYTYSTNNSVDDSTAILNLTLNNSFTQYDTIFICNGEIYSIGNSEYINSGNYLDVLTTQHGCDSIIYTNVSVNSVDIYKMILLYVLVIVLI